MNLHSDDPRLSAWVLGELPPDEAEAIGRAVAADPGLQATVAELREVGAFLGATLAAPTLRPEQRDAVLRAGRRVPAAPVLVAFPERRKRAVHWQAWLATAAVVAIGLFIASRIGTEQRVERETEVALLPLPMPSVSPAVHPASESPRMVAARDRLRRGLEQNPAAFLASLSSDASGKPLPEVASLPATTPLPPLHPVPEIELPVVVGRASFDWVRGWIRDKNQLPPKDAVRIEELANAFPLPPEEEIREFDGLRVACVAMASPWAGPGRLVGVQIANESGSARQVAWSFRPGAGAGRDGVRVLASTGGGDAKPQVLPAGRRTLVLVEIASAGGDAGDLVVATGGRSRRFPARESASTALKPAALAAALGIWLRDEGIDRHGLERVLQVASEDKDPNPALEDSRRLIRQALDIGKDRR